MSYSFNFISVELVLVLGALGILMAAVFGLGRKNLVFAALITVAFAIFRLPSTLPLGQPVFGGMLISDAFGYGMRLFVLLTVAMVIFMSMAYSWFQEEDSGEFYFFILIATVALDLAVCAGNLAMVYLTVETLSIVSYVLVGYFKKDLHSTEAGIKYFLFGALATGLMLYGISLVYGLCGTLDMGLIGTRLAAGEIQGPALVVAAVLILAGLAFKASLVPFHMWVADVYEGAPWTVAAFLSVTSKALGFVLLVRIFFSHAVVAAPFWGSVAPTIAILTMTVGNLAAFHQSSVKRMLAFSSVAQAGYIFAAMALGQTGLTAAFFYIAVYAFMNMGAFAAAAFLSPARSELDAYSGLGRKAPVMAFFFSVFLLSLAGLPPLAGFLAKFFVIRTAVEARDYILAAAVVLNSIIGFFYYLKVIKTMYFDHETSARDCPVSFLAYLLVGGCACGVIFLAIHPQAVLDILALMFV